MRAVAYIRVEQEETPAAQERAIEAWARTERVEVKEWKTDLGVGGATPIAERPGLVAAYRALRAHDARVLVAATADRFAHDELVCWLIERAALMEGAAIRTADGSRHTASSPPPPEPTSFTRGAVELARAHERVTVRARIRAALAERRARGERIGTIPYGHRLSADGVHLEPDPGEQAVISTAQRLAKDGLSQREIVARLGADGVAGRTGAPLRQTQIAKILRPAR
jgi:DNA invertase Pin-like site-specific DNA recombinase